MPDIGSGPAVRTSEGTVAYMMLDGRPVFGVNSNAPGYTVSDETAARDLRQQLVDRYPDIMQQRNTGWRPNDALFHAEANALLRASESSGGTLAGRIIDMRVDRELCPSCDRILPLIGLQLGNPTVRITDGSGDIWLLRDGFWVAKGRQ